MTPCEWWLIYDSKVNVNKRGRGGADLSDEDIEELNEMIKESDV